MDEGRFAATRGAGVVVAVAAALILIVGTAPASAFTDVPADHPYAQAIDDLNSNGILEGYGDGTFGPGNPILRQQFAKVIVRALELPVSEGDVCPFTDVEIGGPNTLYPDNYVAVAAAKGITRGADSTNLRIFRPTSGISRAQTASMTARAGDNLFAGVLRSPPSGFGTLGDVGPDHTAAVSKIEYNLVLGGIVDFGPSWGPWESATRGEVAEALWRLRHLVFPDGGRASPLDILQDFQDKKFDEVYSRAEFEAFLDDPPLNEPGVRQTQFAVRGWLEDHPRIGRILFDGNSLTSGSGGSIPYPSRMMSGWPYSVVWTNVAVGGQTVRDMLADVRTQVDSFFRRGQGRNVIIAWAGTNDIALWDHTAATVHGDLREYITGRRAVGFKVVVLTTLPRTDSRAVPHFEQRRQELNSMIRAGWQEYADALVDVAADHRIGDPEDSNDRTYYTSDLVHLNDRGYAVVADLVKRELLRFDGWAGFLMHAL